MAAILFIYPPTADPTGPYLSIPYLAAAVRSRGHTARVLDLNIAGYLDLLEAGRVRRMAAECRERLKGLPLDGLPWPAASEHLSLALAALGADELADQVDDAVAGLRDPRQFHDPERYEEIFTILERVLALVSARYFPLELAFTRSSSPFALNDAGEIRGDCAPEHNPFHETYLRTLVPALLRDRPQVVGISATFNAQLQQAFAIGRLVRETLPGAHVTLGGTAITQLALRTDHARLRTLGPFADSLVLFEGESTLCAFLDRVDDGLAPAAIENVVDLAHPEAAATRPTAERLDAWPAPDYSDLPLDSYLSPETILYLAPTRGCYWMKCAFCHYGLSAAATASYRRRSVPLFLEDLRRLQESTSARFFYFAGDLIDPRYLFALADGIVEKGLDIRFTSDLRIERSFSAARCRKLRQAGMVAAAFGTESDSPRLLALMEKGTAPEENRRVFQNFAESGIAVQCMTFLEFPSETAAEAGATLDLLEENQERIDLFFVEQFDLETGSRVYREPGRYGLAEVYHPDGDHFRLRARYVEQRPAKRERERERLQRRMERLAASYGRRPYPYAGSVSVAHSLFYFERHGRDVFKRRHLQPAPQGAGPGPAPAQARPRPAPGVVLCDWPYDLEDLALHVGETAAELERRRESELRDVGREAYRLLATEVPVVPPRESYYLLARARGPIPIPRWLWMLLSVLDGTTTVAEAARLARVDRNDAREAVGALLESGCLVLPAGATDASARADARSTRVRS